MSLKRVVFLFFSSFFSLNLDVLIGTINSYPNKKWIAGINQRFENLSLSDFRMLCGSRPSSRREQYFSSIKIVKNLPDYFDSITFWPDCQSIGTIYDQGHCGSCWAVSTFQEIQDRFCIHSKGLLKPKLSAQHLISCAPNANGCRGGGTFAAHNFVKGNGITSEQCIPYQMGTCNHPGCDLWPTPKCNRTCYPQTKIPIDKERFQIKNFSKIPGNEHAIMSEIMTNGPVTGTFAVYTDFAAYKSGIYHHLTGDLEAYHAVKIVGWGIENGTKYWKVINSWNTNWGMDGIFLIERGVNECGIEDDVVSGIPFFNKLVL